MPYLKITTSRSIDAEQKQNLLKAASKAVAAELGKPEQYMMVSAETPISMLFAGTDAPCAFLELRGIGLPESKTGKLSQLLCGLMESKIGIPEERVYINFAEIVLVPSGGAVVSGGLCRRGLAAGWRIGRTTGVRFQTQNDGHNSEKNIANNQTDDGSPFTI
jgi:phenylpyruvate tautomerase